METNTIEKDLKNKNVNNISISNKSVMLVRDKIDWKKVNITKPFLKWVGGKTQILEEILNEFPIQMDNYHEIFLGGGSVLIGLLELKKAGIIEVKNKIYAYDHNKPLIWVYKNIQTTPKKFLNTIIKIINQFYAIEGEEINRKPTTLEQALSSQESYYYWVRSKYNEMTGEEQCSLLGSAYFLFLNKTCFRGVFRMGPNGFNVPFGHYSNPGIIVKAHIKEISQLIKDVEFIHASFEDSLKTISSKSYLFLDPPYFPMNATSFVGYTSDGFDLKLHEKLFKILHELKKQNVNWMMSNSYTKLVLDSFKEKKYSVEKILCRRAINSKNPESKVNEVIIKSY